MCLQTYFVRLNEIFFDGNSSDKCSFDSGLWRKAGFFSVMTLFNGKILWKFSVRTLLNIYCIADL